MKKGLGDIEDGAQKGCKDEYPSGGN